MRSLRLPGWTGTGRSWSGASPHVSHGKPPADCGRLGRVSDDGDNVAHMGMDLLDGLLSSAGVYLDPREVERLLMLAEQHPSVEVRRRAVGSRMLLQP